jgi:hypothetical protein
MTLSPGLMDGAGCLPSGEEFMSAKIEPGGKGRIPYLLRCAFNAAEEGDRDEAYLYYNLAVSEGYPDKPKTRANLEFHLNKASLDPQSPIIEPLPSMNHGGITERIAQRRIWQMSRKDGK